jgi:hypothetical protein
MEDNNDFYEEEMLDTSDPEENIEDYNKRIYQPHRIGDQTCKGQIKLDALEAKEAYKSLLQQHPLKTSKLNKIEINAQTSLL